MKIRPKYLTEREWQQLPFERRYQVLTWQLNVSFYPPAKHVRYVSILRDPIEQVEVLRRGAAPADWPDHLEVIQTHFNNVYSLVEHLTGIGEPF